MPSYSGVDLGDGDVRMHENTALNTELLKGELGFDGFLISDWEGIDKLPGGTYEQKVVRSVNSGVDMAMAPYNFGAFITSVTDAVGEGTISEDRVDDAVRRILAQKFALGLFEDAYTDDSRRADFGSDAHRAVAREAAADSQVLLKNDGALPLAKTDTVYVAGSNADNLGHQLGGWSISWQGGSGDTTTGTTILEGIRQVAPDGTYSADASAPTDGHDVGVVVVGEAPYAEGQGDVGNNGKSLSLSVVDQTAIDRVCAAMKCVVLVVAGRTQLVTDKLAEIDGLVASFLPGSEGAGVADVLFGDVPFTGRLPLSWPATAEQVPINVGDEVYAPLYAYGWGVRTDVARDRVVALSSELPAGAARTAVEELAEAAVWDATGALSPSARAIALVAAAAAQLSGTDRDALESADELVSVVRDAAQQSMIAGTGEAGSAARTADAEHALASGEPELAVDLLASVIGVDASRVILDDFDRVDGRVGSQWAGATAASLYRVVDSTLDAQLGGPLVWRESFGADQEASVELSRIDSTGRPQGLLLKAQSTGLLNTSGITVAYDGKSKSVAVSTSRSLFTGSKYGATDVAFAEGDVLAARVSVAGTVEVLRNGEVVATVRLYAADRAYFGQKGGRIGVWSLGATRAVFDDFGGGETVR